MPVKQKVVKATLALPAAKGAKKAIKRIKNAQSPGAIWQTKYPRTSSARG